MASDCPYLNSILYIYDDTNEKRWGCGYLITPEYAITCAHVVADALGDTNLASLENRPDGKLKIASKALPEERKWASIVEGGWFPKRDSLEEGQDEKYTICDLAVLRIEPPLCDKSTALAALTQEEMLAIKDISIFVLRKAYSSGISLMGKISNIELSQGRYQIETTTNIEPGDSGLPVKIISDKKIEIAGLIVQRDEGEPTIGFLIPAEVLHRAILQSVGDLLPTVVSPKIRPAITPDVTQYLKKLSSHLDSLLLQMECLQESDDIIPRRIHKEGDYGSNFTLEEFIIQNPGFILYGGPGSGKSTSLCLLAKQLASSACNLSDTTQLLPIYIQAREINEDVRDIFEQGGSSKEIPEFLQQTIWQSIFKPWNISGQVYTMDGREEKLKGSLRNEYTLVLIIEGFDELVSPNELNKPLTTLLTDQLKSVGRALIFANFKMVVSSRDSTRSEIRQLGLTATSLLDIDIVQVTDYLKSKLDQYQKHFETIAQYFVNKLDATPLYLIPLCEYIKNYSDSNDLKLEGLSPVKLLEAQINHQIQHNSLKDNVDGNIQMKCLRRVSEVLRYYPYVNKFKLKKIIELVIKNEGSLINYEQIIGTVALFLIEQPDDQFYFRHLEYRDYWIANAVLTFLSNEGLDWEHEESNLLLCVLHEPRVLDMLIELSIDSTARDDVIVKLKEIIKEKTSTPSDRKTPSLPAAALSILVRIYQKMENVNIKNIDCSNKCFQGLAGKQQSFRGVNFEKSNLQESDLRGADLSDCNFRNAILDNVHLDGACLQNSELSDANLRNVSMGEFKTENHSEDYRPTDLRNAELSGSNWFNFRMTLEGYLQFWKGIIIPNTQNIILTTSRGSLILLSKLATDGEQYTKQHIQTQHTMDLLDFDVHPETHTSHIKLVTCGRDGYLNLSKLPANVEHTELISSTPEYHFNDYPRCVKFSTSGRWIAVTDRAHNVSFQKTDSFESPDNWNPNVCQEHTGPVVCLQKDSDGNRDYFYTAGYDSKVLRHVENLSSGNEKWHSELLVDLNEKFPEVENGTIRSICLWKPDPSFTAKGLCIGDESGRLSFWCAKTKETILIKQGLKQEIFSIALNADHSRLAVGCSEGKVVLYNFVKDQGIIDLKGEYCFQMPNQDDDIVRSLSFFEDNLLCVSWAGQVCIRSLTKNEFIFVYCVDSSDWKPEKDHNKLRFDVKSDVEKITGLSRNFRQYLTYLISN